jgi:hypothetical protein
MSVDERKIENPKPRIALVARCVSIFFGLFCIAVGVSALYLLNGDSFWLSVAFLGVGFCYIGVASFASDRVMFALTFFWP